MSLTNSQFGKWWQTKTMLRAQRSTSSWTPQCTPPWRRPRRYIPGLKSRLVADVVEVNRLMYCFERNRMECGHGPGVDGLRYHDFGRQELSRALGRLRAAVLDGSFRPRPALPVNIPKDGGAFRGLLLNVVTERALATSLKIALTPIYKPLMSPLTYSVGGKHSGVEAMLADLAATFEVGAYTVLLNLDVKKAFDSVPIDRLMAVVARWLRP